MLYRLAISIILVGSTAAVPTARDGRILATEKKVSALAASHSVFDLEAHKKAMQKEHSNSMPVCDETSVAEEHSSFATSYEIPFVGKQEVAVTVYSPTTARVKMSGVHSASCNVSFELSRGGRVDLSACKLPDTISLKSIQYCKSSKALHALVATPFADIPFVAAAQLPDGWTNTNSGDEKWKGTTFMAECSCMNKMCSGDCSSDSDSWCASTCKSSSSKCMGDPGGNSIRHDCSDPRSSGSCFAKDSTTACLLASPAAECEPILVADLAVGDLVLGRDGATTVVAVQHKAVDTIAEMLTFHTADGASVSMTHDHAVFVSGKLVAAANVKVGSLLSTGAVTHITKSEGAIINAVTASGTIVADGVIAASNPYWIASLTVDAPLPRAIVNAALYAAGDVDSVAAGIGGVFAKITATLVVAAVALKARADARRGGGES